MAKRYTKSKDFGYARMYMKWNYTTACCFLHKTKCENCPNNIVCEKFDNETEMHPIKYSTLMTYRNIGLEGIREYLKENYDTRNE